MKLALDAIGFPLWNPKRNTKSRREILRQEQVEKRWQQVGVLRKEKHGKICSDEKPTTKLNKSDDDMKRWIKSSWRNKGDWNDTDTMSSNTNKTRHFIKTKEKSAHNSVDYAFGKINNAMHKRHKNYEMKCAKNITEIGNTCFTRKRY